MKPLLLALVLSLWTGSAWAQEQTNCAVPPTAHAPTSAGRAASPQVLARANAAARQGPSEAGFVAARQIYAFAPGALYQVHANPNYISTILLEPGETLNDIAAGDSARWMVAQAQGETESQARTIVLVKPQAAGLRTNIVLITDRRTYLVEAIAQAGDVYAAEISWCYASDPAPLLDPTALNFNYRTRVLRGRRPAWAPSRVFDDGARTWIEFSPDIAAHDLAPLFVIGGEGPELVNYRVEGHRYVVDRVFDAAELRMGLRAPVIVRIERTRGRRP
ncbi:MAG TPA: TrbG/VirB9 family P-type conjugative transfer protein [Verrucomicrobiae bacterium]|nr:TrbG/VirB9 family P-type conjugative transfer protein [Verrucomicrobiae bacterium]